MLVPVENSRVVAEPDAERKVLLFVAVLCLIGMGIGVWPELIASWSTGNSALAHIVLRALGALLALGAFVGGLSYLRTRAHAARNARRRLLDAARDAVFVVDDRGYVTLCNPAAEDVFGLPADTLMRHPYPELFGTVVTEAGVSLRELLMVGQANVDDVFAYTRPDGSRLHLHVSLGRLRDERGVTSGLVGTAQDVTARVRDHQELAHREAEYRGLVLDVLNDTRVGLVILDAEQRIVWICKAIEQYFGVERDAVQGLSIQALWREHIAGYVRDQTVVQRVLTSYTDDRFLRDEAFFLTEGDGRLARWMEYWSQPIERGTYAGGRIEHFHDITRRIRAKQELEHANERLHLFNQLTEDLLNLRAPETLASAALDRLRTLINADSARLFMYAEDEKTLVKVAASEAQPRWGALHETVVLAKRSLPRQLQRREPFVLPQRARIDAYDSLRPLREGEPPVETFALVPLLLRGQLQGVLELTGRRPFAFGDSDLATAQEAASQLSVAMHNAQLIEKLAARRDRMREMSSRLVRMQEDERRELATELHDRIGQTLAGLNFTLAAVEQYCSDTDAPVHEARTTVARLVQDVQDLSQELRPPLLDDFGIMPALRWLTEHVQQAEGLTLRVRQANVAGKRYSPDVETAVYRLVQESLTHLVRRPEVTEALVRLWSMPEMLYLDVEAIASAERSQDALFPTMVQSNLRQRVALMGGQLGVRPAPGGGWRVEAQLPLK